MPADLCNKMMADREARVLVTDEGDGYARMKFTSQYMPMDVTWKWGEEFEHCLPMPGGATEKYTCLETLVGDTVTGIWKNDKVTLVTTIKYTDNYAIEVGKQAVFLSLCETDTNVFFTLSSARKSLGPSTGARPSWRGAEGSGLVPTGDANCLIGPRFPIGTQMSLSNLGTQKINIQEGMIDGAKSHRLFFFGAHGRAFLQGLRIPSDFYHACQSV